ncbi:MAG: LysM peptidoglycan-binding domain-containing protein [Bacteroidetes bacterium]|nr:MAG: LysM peptidoglycan-binding domain-containing protein [Bacteroidota bacterium]
MRAILLPAILHLIPLLPAQGQIAAELRIDSLCREYVRKFGDIAMDEMERSGIPASIKLAQGILESRAGTSELALLANNHFGIKCSTGWNGETHFKHDDEQDRAGQPLESCFRKYDSVVACFADHSDFILNPKKKYRYGFLFDLDPLDYSSWARGLQDAGYSSAAHYAEKLIHYIELHQLAEYDQQVFRGRLSMRRFLQFNGVKVIQARHGETLRRIARLYNLSADSLAAFNDRQHTPDQPLTIGSWVYMEPKQDRWNGPETFHVMETSQHLLDVAQRYGISLDALRKRNGLQSGQEPAPFEYIRLRGNQGLGEKVMTIQAKGGPLPEHQRQMQPLGVHSDTTTSGLIIEMLPEQPLERPVAVYAGSSAVSPQPDDDTGPAVQSVEMDTKSGEVRIYHTVRKSDTLYSIARLYDRSPSDLRQLNGLTGSQLRPGQRLRIQ